MSIQYGRETWIKYFTFQITVNTKKMCDGTFRSIHTQSLKLHTQKLIHQPDGICNASLQGSVITCKQHVCPDIEASDGQFKENMKFTVYILYSFHANI